MRDWLGRTPFQFSAGETVETVERSLALGGHPAEARVLMRGDWVRLDFTLVHRMLI